MVARTALVFGVALIAAGCGATTHHASNPPAEKRNNAMWVGGPPNHMHPIRPHSRTITGNGVFRVAAPEDIKRAYANSVEPEDRNP